MIVNAALICLALNVYHEARSEIIPGQYAVALVTMNRAKSDDRVCHETFRHKQFSWTVGTTRVEAGWLLPQHLRPNLDNPIEKHAWVRAKRIAAVTLSGQMGDLTKGADHYHATYVRPSWARRMDRAIQIGQHIFYVPKQRSQP
jgi:spore germination cell wall hydrolase CwlJ-like protein